MQWNQSTYPAGASKGHARSPRRKGLTVRKVCSRSAALAWTTTAVALASSHRKRRGRKLSDRGFPQLFNPRRVSLPPANNLLLSLLTQMTRRSSALSVDDVDVDDSTVSPAVEEEGELRQNQASGSSSCVTDACNYSRLGTCTEAQQGGKYCYSHPGQESQGQGELSSSTHPPPSSLLSSTSAIQGSLGAFSELPLDVVSDIASQGDMGTVLSLSRLNRSLRSFLTSKRVAGVWEQARVNSELPELKAKKAPTVMQYADLMFGTRCMVSEQLGSRKGGADIVRRCRPVGQGRPELPSMVCTSGYARLATTSSTSLALPR